MTVSPVYKLWYIHAAKSLYSSIFWWRHIALVSIIINKYMVPGLKWKLRPSPILWEHFKDSTPPRIHLLAIRILIAQSAHNSICGLFCYIQLLAKSKLTFGSCFQLSNGVNFANSECNFFSTKRRSAVNAMNAFGNCAKGISQGLAGQNSVCCGLGTFI